MSDEPTPTNEQVPALARASAARSAWGHLCEVRRLSPNAVQLGLHRCSLGYGSCWLEEARD